MAVGGTYASLGSGVYNFAEQAAIFNEIVNEQN